MFCVIPFQKVVVHCLSASSGFHSIFQSVKGTEIVGFSFACNLRLPFSAFCRVIHAGVSADVGGNGVAFLDASKIATDVPSHSFRLSIMLAACRQPQLLSFRLVAGVILQWFPCRSRTGISNIVTILYCAPVFFRRRPGSRFPAHRRGSKPPLSNGGRPGISTRPSDGCLLSPSAASASRSVPDPIARQGVA